MTDEVIERVLRSPRYRDVDRQLVARVAAEEIPRSRTADDAVKRVKRRLHQAVGAYRGGATNASGGIELARRDSTAWDEGTRAWCLRALAWHASTRERIGHLDRFYPELWSAIGGAPASVLDLACGLNPLALPFMGLDPGAEYLACDSDGRALDQVERFLAAVGQPHRTWACDLVTGAPDVEADVALLLKTVPILDRQDRGAAPRLLRGVRARHVIVSFPARALGRSRRALTYPARMDDVLAELAGFAAAVRAIEFGSETAFVLRMSQRHG